MPQQLGAERVGVRAILAHDRDAIEHPARAKADDDGAAGDDDHGADGRAERGLLGEVHEASTGAAAKQPEAQAER